MRTPLVSVIMPMYNGLPFVKDAISSILGQSFRDFELLVVDNGSTDGSLQYVSSLAEPESACFERTPAWSRKSPDCRDICRQR